MCIYIRYLTYKSQAAQKDHDNDECLEIVVLHQPKHAAAKTRPDSAEAVVIESRETRTYLRTARRTAFIRILDEYDLDVVNFRAFAAGSAGVGEIVDGVGEVAAGKNALLAAFWRLRRRRR